MGPCGLSARMMMILLALLLLMQEEDDDDDDDDAPDLPSGELVISCNPVIHGYLCPFSP